MQFSKTSKKTNNDEMNEGSATKHRRKAGSAVPSEVPSEKNPPVTKAAAASAGASSDSISSVAIDSVGVITNETRHEDVAKLAHSYWIARGYAHGSPEEDWLRAERELKAKR